LKFSGEIWEYTEASYHYPQGTHLGHILSIVWYFGLPDRAGSHVDDKYIRMRGQLGEGRISAYRRQLKYKLQAAMELGVLEDDRRAAADVDFTPQLTPLGREFRAALENQLATLDLRFPPDDEGIPSSRMSGTDEDYLSAIRNVIEQGGAETVFRVFLGMHAVQQMLAFLFQVARTEEVERRFIYENFFKAPFVKRFLDQEGIEEATEGASKRRCPFLINILDALGIVKGERSTVKLQRLALIPSMVSPFAREGQEASERRLRKIKAAWPHGAEQLDPEDISIVRELFGADFLTPEYRFQDAIFFEEA